MSDFANYCKTAYLVSRLCSWWNCDDWGDYCPFIWEWGAVQNTWHSGLGNSFIYFYNLHFNTYSKNPFKPSIVFTACCKPWKWHIVYFFFLGSEQPIQLQLLLAVELLFTILIVCVLCKWICNYLVPNLTTLGLQDIGNGNDIDIGVQYCVINNTCDIFTRFTHFMLFNWIWLKIC